MLVSTATIHDVLLDFKIAEHYADQIVIEIEKRAEWAYKSAEKAALNSILVPHPSQNFSFYDPELAKRMQQTNTELVNRMIEDADLTDTKQEAAEDRETISRMKGEW